VLFLTCVTSIVTTELGCGRARGHHEFRQFVLPLYCRSLRKIHLLISIATADGASDETAASNGRMVVLYKDGGGDFGPMVAVLAALEPV
jgi:hypothetical protein